MCVCVCMCVCVGVCACVCVCVCVCVLLGGDCEQSSYQCVWIRRWLSLPIEVDGP